MWINQSSKKTLEITFRAGALYDKFEGFVGDLIKIGKKKKQNEYSGAMNKRWRRKEIN
jgi:DNA recombination protein RmuC